MPRLIWLCYSLMLIAVFTPTLHAITVYRLINGVDSALCFSLRLKESDRPGSLNAPVSCESNRSFAHFGWTRPGNSLALFISSL